MQDYKIFDEIASVHLTALETAASPWPLIVLTSVFALIFLGQIMVCALNGLDGEWYFRLCRARGIPAYLYELAEDGDTDLPLPVHWAAEIQVRGC